MNLFLPLLLISVTIIICILMIYNSTDRKPPAARNDYAKNKNSNTEDDYTDTNQPINRNSHYITRSPINDNRYPNNKFPVNENRYIHTNPPINEPIHHITKAPINENKNIDTKSPIYENKNRITEPPIYKPAQTNEKTVLLITLIHSSEYIDSFFSLIDKFTYPKSKISIGILEGDSPDYDHTMEVLNKNIDKNKPLYRRINVVHKNSNLRLEDRRTMHLQLQRRSKLAELRNYVLKQTLNDEEYVLWIDSDVVISPHNNIIELMMSVDKDIVVPNCLLDTSNDARYDANTWILTQEVIDYINRKPKDYFLMNPYIQFPTTWMKTIYEFRDPNKPLLYQIDVDAVGGTMILAKSKVFKSGVVFPEQLYDHCVETEGFGRMAKNNGFQLVGLPNLIIYHAHNR